ncbi:MAG: SurA N-terminal domain-containing protein [Myxococcota bacterium]
MIAALALLALSAVPEGAVLLDGVAAVVDREVITRSDVERSARLALLRRGGAAEGLRAPVDDGLRAAVLNLLIVEELVLLDGRRRQRFPETDEDVRRHATAVRARFASDAQFEEFLRATQLPEPEFMEMMRREARVDRLVGEQMAGATVTDDDVARLVAEHPELQGHPDEARAAALHARRQQAAFEYVEHLRKNANIRVVARYLVPTEDAR